MIVASSKWFRRFLLVSIYVLGVLGILGSGGGGGDDLECLSWTYVPGCGDPPTYPNLDLSDFSDLSPDFSDPSPAPNNSTVLSGRFIDSAVEGLRFETPTQSGLTDTNGNFKFISGERVSFLIGDILLGTSNGFTQLTPMNLVPGDSNNPQVINILRFVQSLDEDNNPDNGIRIPEIVTIQALGQTLDFSLPAADFEISANALLTLLTSGSVNMLVDANSAQAHFIASLQTPADVFFTGTAICDDFGGLGDFGCRIVQQATPLDLALTITDDTASLYVEIENGQYIELIDTDGDPEQIAVAVFVTNNGVDNASVSMKIAFTDENGLSMNYAIATIGTFTPGFSGFVSFSVYPNFQNVSPIIYHGMRLDVDVVGGPITFGEFSQANIFQIDPSSNVGN